MMKKLRELEEDGYGRRRSATDDVLEDFFDRSSSSSRRSSVVLEKTENNNVKKKTMRSETIYTARPPDVRSWSTTTIPDFDQFEKFWEEFDRDHDRLRKRRDRDRETARVAVDGIRETADLEGNRDAVKELESMCECSDYYVLGGNPLMSLGLFLKPEYSDINDEDEKAILFGNTRWTKGWSTQHKVEKEESGTENIKQYSSPLLQKGTTKPTLSCGYAASSPRKDHDRVEMLKLRYKDTILKAQKALGLPADYDKQQAISQKTTEVPSRSTTTTAEFDQFETFGEEIDRDHLSMRRERDREAARVAVDGIQETADLESDRDAVKELESLCECSDYFVLGGNPLMSLGLFLKPEYSDEDEQATLFEDIHCTKKPCVHKSRSMQHKVEKEQHNTGNIKHYSSGLLLNAPIEATPSCGHATSSPRKVYDRVEMLKLRYKDTIRKAQKALGLPADYDKQQGMGPKTTEVRSRSTTTTTEFDRFEKFREEIDRDPLRRRRERDREAARVAVDGIRDTADLESNRDAVKELESMSECSSYYVLGRNPLISLGLFLKHDEDEEAILFGDIHRTKKRCIQMDRSMQHKVEKEEYGSQNIKHYSSGLLLNGTIEAKPSCGYAKSSSPRKDQDRVEMLKSRYQDTILKAQKALGLSADDNKQQGIGLKTTSRRRQYCKSKATINAPIRGATHA